MNQVTYHTYLANWDVPNLSLIFSFEFHGVDLHYLSQWKMDMKIGYQSTKSKELT